MRRGVAWPPLRCRPGWGAPQNPEQPKLCPKMYTLDLGLGVARSRVFARLVKHPGYKELGFDGELLKGSWLPYTAATALVSFSAGNVHVGIHKFRAGAIAPLSRF